MWEDHEVRHAQTARRLMIGAVALGIAALIAALGVSTVNVLQDGLPGVGPDGPAPTTAPTQWTTSSAAGDELTDSSDRFGVKKKYPTRPGGMVWYSNWQSDTEDPWVTRIGNARYEVEDGGVLSLSGETMRMYIHDPAEKRQWTGDVEVTVYAKRVPDQTKNSPEYTGIVSDVRTNHGTVGNVEQDPCDSRGLFARLRFDGTADFGKEVRHPNTVATDAVGVWDGGMPEDEWIGYKQVVYTTEQGVVQELWVDFPGEGEKWVLINQHVDTGHGWGAGERSCRKGIRPDLPLLGGTSRQGSESGLPNISVLLRADDLGDGGLEYRWASVRQVEVPR
jgi:hypothetical protein